MKQACPPRLFLRFFRWYCRPTLLDRIEGDLMEVYQEQFRSAGKRKADWRFMVDVILLFRPGIVKPFQYQRQNTSGMFKSYFKTGWRNLAKQRAFSAINIGGLALGMAVAVFIGLWIYDEISFDRSHKHYEAIAKVWHGYTSQETQLVEGGYALQYPVAATLRSNYGQYFEEVLMAWWMMDFTLTVDDKKFSRTGEFIEEGGPEMLSLSMLSGSYQSLHDPHSIILSKSLAKAMFGDENPLNKRLMIDNKVEAMVTGVYEDIPANSSFSNVHFFAPWALLKLLMPWTNNRETDWDNQFVNAYVRLRPNVTAEEVNSAIHDLYAKNSPPDLYKTVEKYHPFIQVIPMSKWHLYSEFKDGKPTTGRITYVWLFGIVGVFVLLLACINFVNLATARSERRAREVGVRKAMGSLKGQLVFQFISESFIVVILAFAFSLVLVTLLLDSFNEITAKQIRVPLGSVVFWLMSFGFVVFTSLLAGLYPAFYLSSFKPVKVLKGVMRTGQFAVLPRQLLVVVQFTVSVMLTVGTLVVYKQIQHARNRPVGYSRAGLLSVPLNDPAYGSKLGVLQAELINTGATAYVATSSSPMTEVNNVTGGYTWQGKDPNFDPEFANYEVSPEFGKTIGWQIVEGRDFSTDIPADTISSVIINEAAARYIGMIDPVGQEFINTDSFGKFESSSTIIGVVKDIIMTSPYAPVQPTIFHYGANARGVLHIRMNPAMSTSDALARIKTVFDAIVPSALFNYKFVDEEYALKFSQEERIAKLSGVFAGLAVAISCLGLFGLISYVAEQRTKEIGIRKVVGASVFAIWKMLSKEFIVLVLIASFIAIPIAAYFLSGWLAKFEYRTTISWWIPALSAFSALAVTLLTVSTSAIKAARMNPAKSLRSE